MAIVTPNSVEALVAVPTIHRPSLPEVRRFNVDEYHCMAEAGILKPDERVELLEGEITCKFPSPEEYRGRNYARRRFSTAELSQLEQIGILREDERLELIDGDILVMNPIGSKHSECVTVLSRMLYRHPEEGKAFLVRSQNPLLLDEGNEAQPDFAFVQVRSDGNWNAVPSITEAFLTIEVSDSSLRYDRDVKAPLYAKFGVPEVWLVDLTHSKIEVRLRPNDGAYEELRTYHRGETVASTRLPQLSLDVSAILGA